MDGKLLTQKDLADRWQVSEKTVETYRKEGIITPVSFIKHPRFEPTYIKKIEQEGVKLEKFSPLERKKLERRIDELEKENALLREIGLNLLSESARLASINLNK